MNRATSVGHASLAAGAGLGLELVDQVDDVEEAAAGTIADGGAGNGDEPIRKPRYQWGVGAAYGASAAQPVPCLHSITSRITWPNASSVEMATLQWVDWFNNHRLFGPIGHIPPAEAEANYYAATQDLDMVA